MNSSSPLGPSGLIMLAHGARDPRWADPFEQVASQVRQARPDAQVRLAYLEFMAPDLVAAGTELAQAGCTEVRLLPLFLGAGGHVRKDVPRLLAELQQRHPNVRWQLCTAVGEWPELGQALAGIATATLAGRGAVA